jgi:hypothetical protein
MRPRPPRAISSPTSKRSSSTRGPGDAGATNDAEAGGVRSALDETSLASGKSVLSSPGRWPLPPLI